MKRFFACVLFCVPLFSGAQIISQHLTLKEGWNAFYLEVTPMGTTCAATNFFGALPVTKASCYLQDAFLDTQQYSTTGEKIEGKATPHLIWNRDQPEASTLETVMGGNIFFCFATNAADITVRGVPVPPRFQWRKAGATLSASLNLVAPVLDEDVEVPLTSYFGEGPFGVLPPEQDVYTLGGKNAQMPTALRVFRPERETCKRGSVYLLTAGRTMEWSGAIRLYTTDPRGVFFDGKSSLASFTVVNDGTKRRTVKISQMNSEEVSELRPPLRMYKAATTNEAASWSDFSEQTITLDPGVSVTYSLALDYSQSLSPDKTYASLIRAEDVDGGTSMRLLLPVRAVVEAETAENPAFPKGLWAGKLVISQVNRGGDSVPQKAAGVMKADLLIHVNQHGVASLLQRVALGRETNSNGVSRLSLFREPSDAPTGVTAYRISSLILDTVNQTVAETVNPDGSSSHFGTVSTFSFVVDQHSKENPFRHAWHPDHDGKKADYSGAAPSGDLLKNYIGSVKPETFSVTNTLTFTWQDVEGKTTFGYNADESTYGRCDWVLEGLRKERIWMRGTFLMKRVVKDAEIEGAEVAK